MTFENLLVSSRSYGPFLTHLRSTETLKLKLDPHCGWSWEKIKIDTGEEYFNLEKVTMRIHALSKRKNIDENERKAGEEVCDIFEGLWLQLDKELGKLNCTNALFYKTMHYPSSALYFDWNPDWIDFWSPRSTVLKRSWGLFDARFKLQ